MSTLATTSICDRCLREFTQSVNTPAGHGFPKSVVTRYSVARGHKNFELCEDCAQSFDEWAKQGA